MTKQEVFDKLPHRAVLILQGIPGSGKSTLVDDLANYMGNIMTEEIQVCSNDHFWINDKTGKYEYNSHFHDEAVFFCQQNFNYWANLPLNKRPIYLVVDNTHTNLKAMQFYLDGAKKAGWDAIIITLECDVETGTKRNIHKVPANTIKSMADKIKNFKTPPNVTHYTINE